MFSSACSATPLLVLPVISFLPYLLCNWGPGRQEGLPLPFLDKTRKQEVVSLPLLARSWRKERKEKPLLHPKESWGIWAALSIRQPLSAPCFLLGSSAHTGSWMKRETRPFLCHMAALSQKAQRWISAWTELPTKKGFNLCPTGEKFDCDSTSLFRNCIPQLVTQSPRALVPGLNPASPVWSSAACGKKPHKEVVSSGLQVCDLLQQH